MSLKYLRDMLTMPWTTQPPGQALPYRNMSYFKSNYVHLVAENTVVTQTSQSHANIGLNHAEIGAGPSL